MGLSLFVPQIGLQILSYLLIALGFWLALKKFPARLRLVVEAWNIKSKKEKWFIIALAIYLLSFYMNSTIFHGFGLIQDALVYHLEGPKEWALFLNGARFNANNPITFTTSYYDYYYYFLFLIAKPLFVQTASLSTTHYEFFSYAMLLTAQLFTGLVAIVLCPLVILRLSTSLGLYRYLAVFFIFGLRLITWSWVLPKNDPYSFLCFSMSAYLFYQHYILKFENSDKRALFLAACILGIGTASKLTNAYVVIFSLMFFFVFYFKSISIYLKGVDLKKAVLFAIAGLGLGVSVLLARNGPQTGNPFYPIAKFGFPNVYLSTYADRPQLYSDPGTWSEALTKIKMHFESQIQLIMILLLALFTRARKLALFYVLMVIYMAKQTGIMFTFRMTTIFLLLALIIFNLVVHELILKKPSLKFPKILPAVLIFTVVIFAKIQVEKFVKYPYRYYPQPISQAARENIEHWDYILEENLTHRNDDQYVFAPKLEIFPYFSRFPAISLYDSVEKYRYNYYKKTDQ